MRYQIMMDSCGDLSEKMKECREVVSIPLRIRIGNEELTDDETLDCREMLKKMSMESGMIGSSCPSPSQFVEKRDREAEHIYILTGSSVLTGSYTSARLAAQIMRAEAAEEKCGQRICVIDSKSASAGQTLLAAQIMQWEREGVEYPEIKNKIKWMIRNMQTRFVLESLEMLEKSGRLTGLKAKIADALNICPVLRSNGEGAISQCGQGRGIKRSLGVFEKQIIKEVSAGIYGPLIISHCQCPERAFSLKIAIHEKYPHVAVRIVETKGISSMYAGKGGIVAAYVVGTGNRWKN